MQQAITLLSILFLLGGCASYQAVSIDEHNPELALEVEQIDLDTTSVRIAIVRDSTTSTKYYSRDLIAQRILPVQVFVTNSSSDETLAIDPDKFRIVTPDNATYTPMHAGDVIERAKFSQGQSVGWFIGFGIIGAAISAANVSNANKILVDDYNQKALKSSFLSPVSTTSGTVFFDFGPAAADMESLDGHQIELPLALSSGEELMVVQDMSGEVAFRKASSKDKHGAERFDDRENY